MINDRIDKVAVPKDKRIEGLSLYPWSFLPYLPPCECVFDSYRRTIGYDIFPFAITTRIAAACEVYLMTYEEYEQQEA